MDFRQHMQVRLCRGDGDDAVTGGMRRPSRRAEGGDSQVVPDRSVMATRILEFLNVVQARNGVTNHDGSLSSRTGRSLDPTIGAMADVLLPVRTALQSGPDRRSWPRQLASSGTSLAIRREVVCRDTSSTCSRLVASMRLLPMAVRSSGPGVSSVTSMPAERTFVAS